MSPAIRGAGRGVLIVFAKAPRPGMVKTRMVPPLTDEQAASLYTHMLDDVLEASGEFAAALDLDIVLALYPADACADFASRVPRSARVVAQQGIDLAERMSFAIMEAAATGATRILIRGSDSPMLELDLLRAALAALDEADVVISPDLDGGYGLLGVSAPAPVIFDHPMSTGTVYDETRGAAEHAGLRCHVLPSCFDIDRAADLAQLAAGRADGRATLCARTLAYLDSEDLWPTAESASNR